MAEDPIYREIDNMIALVNRHLHLVRQQLWPSHAALADLSFAISVLHGLRDLFQAEAARQAAGQSR